MKSGIFTLSVLLVFAFCWARPVRAQGVPIVITSAPYTITQSGAYVLGNNINYTGFSGAIIQVEASNVTIDFAGHYIAGPVGNPNQTVVGIRANERSNLTVKNGTIAFCAQGIWIFGNFQNNTNNVGHRIENMRVTYCYALGAGLQGSPGSRVVSCRFSQLGNPAVSGQSATGLFLAGVGTVARDNDISNGSLGSVLI